MKRIRPRTTAQRGYGHHHHQKMRRKYASLVASGCAWCARCGEPIEPGEPWDLCHDDYDRSKYMGPERARCNRGAPNRCTTSPAW
jgi:hypothetical protein